jgi:hypothetical protein
MGYNARNDEIRDNIARVQREPRWFITSNDP